MHVDPFRTPGRWVVTTASAARHLIDSTDPDAPVTITRLANGADHPPDDGMRLAELRRDGQALQLLALRHIDPAGHIGDGIAVGADMQLTLEPLAAAATATVRRTTPVLNIQMLGSAQDAEHPPPRHAEAPEEAAEGGPMGDDESPSELEQGRAPLSERLVREQAERARQRRILLEALGVELRDLDAAAECECSCHPRPGTPDVHGDRMCSCQLSPHERREQWAQASQAMSELGEHLRAAAAQQAAEVQAAADRLGVEAYQASEFAPWVIAGTIDGRAFYMRERSDMYSIVIADDDHPAEQPWTAAPGEDHALVIKTGTSDDIYIGNPPDHGKALQYIVTVVRDHLRRAMCAHVRREGDRFCPACGERLPNARVGEPSTGGQSTREPR